MPSLVARAAGANRRRGMRRTVPDVQSPGPCRMHHDREKRRWSMFQAYRFTQPSLEQLEHRSLPASLSLTTFPLTDVTGGGIALGSDGNLWVTEGAGTFFPSKIGRITPAGALTDFDLPSGS